MQAVEFRSPQPTDATAINQFVATCRGETYGLGDDWQRQHMAWMLSYERIVATCREIRESAINPADRLYTVLGDATITAVLNAENRGDSLELRHLFVASALRNRGIGGRLMAQYDRWAGLAPSLPSTVDVASCNKRAIQFYEQYGFIPVDGSQETWQDVLIITMQREIT